jgi:anti-sigma regulatory factor (Ser/Thr protein kinase)
MAAATERRAPLGIGPASPWVAHGGGIPDACRTANPFVAPLMAGDTFEIRVPVASTMATGRNILQNGLQAWGCGNITDMVLVFSELVTNAMVHTEAASTTVIKHMPPTVRIEVHDRSSIIPALRHDTRPGGVGLRIVSQLSGSWGWHHTATGKVVWSVIACGH